VVKHHDVADGKSLLLDPAGWTRPQSLGRQHHIVDGRINRHTGNGAGNALLLQQLDDRPVIAQTLSQPANSQDRQFTAFMGRA